jgi:uncharacterized protein (TIGR02265 family)
MREPAFFGSAFEGLYVKALGPTLTPAMKAGLAARGLDLSRPLLAAYSDTVWFDCLDFTARTLTPHLREEAGIEALGTLFLRGFEETLIGGALFQIARLIGIERTLLRVERSARTTSNVFSATVKTLGPGHLCVETRLEPDFVGRVRAARSGHPHFEAGIIRGMFGALDLVPPRLKVTLYDAATRHSAVEVRWDAEATVAARP